MPDAKRGSDNSLFESLTVGMTRPGIDPKSTRFFDDLPTVLSGPVPTCRCQLHNAVQIFFPHILTHPERLKTLMQSLKKLKQTWGVSVTRLENACPLVSLYFLSFPQHNNAKTKHHSVLWSDHAEFISEINYPKRSPINCLRGILYYTWMYIH